MMIDPRIYLNTDPESVWTEMPKWVASISDLPENTYLVPEHDQSTILLSKNGIKALSNICTHKNATILSGRGALSSVITCSIHKWTWELNGELRGARGFKKTCDKNLEKKELKEWKGHVFSGDGNLWPTDLDQKMNDLSSWIDLRNHKWYSSSRIEYNFDWKIFMEIFLDLYHIKSYHPGLSSMTDCSTFDWIFGEGWSCQTALFSKATPKEEGYAKLYEFYKKTKHIDNAIYGAVWLGIYPNTMIEYYPGSIVVSTVWPNGPGKCINHLEFYYEKEILSNFPDFPVVHQETFMKTADEDEDIGNRMQKGLSMRKNQVPMHNHPVEEAGYLHFHEWLSKVSQPDVS